MNNKKLGTEFEKEFCKFLKDKGYWVHFISPDNTGAQPFDVIALKKDKSFAFDCKTSSKPIFSIDRLEWNQEFAFDMWIDKVGSMPLLAIKYEEHIYLVPYGILKRDGKVDLREREWIV